MPRTSDLVQTALRAFVLSVSSFPKRGYGLLLSPDNSYGLCSLLGLSPEEETNVLINAGLLRIHRGTGVKSIVKAEFERFIMSCCKGDERITHTHTLQIKAAQQQDPSLCGCWRRSMLCC